MPEGTNFYKIKSNIWVMRYLMEQILTELSWKTGKIGLSAFYREFVYYFEINYNDKVENGITKLVDWNVVGENLWQVDENTMCDVISAFLSYMNCSNLFSSDVDAGVTEVRATLAEDQAGLRQHMQTGWT